MRLYLQVSKNKQLIPFNYQEYLVGAIHKWLGKNNTEHGKMSLYSFSWFQNIDTQKDGINLKQNAYFFISAYDDDIIKKILQGILTDPTVCFGAKVVDVNIIEQPPLNSNGLFSVASPVLVKKTEGNKIYHLLYNDSQTAEFLTGLMCKKMAKAGVSSEGLKIKFDDAYHAPQVKLIKYRNIGNKVSLCPIIVEGTQEQLTFVWNVGVGNSTGIGFGALK